MQQKISEIFQINFDNGFWKDRLSILDKINTSGLPKVEIDLIKSALMDQLIALIGTEVSEAIDANRKGLRVDVSGGLLKLTNPPPNYTVDQFRAEFEEKVKGSLEDELADIYIRLLDFCGGYNIDLETHVDLKLEYNKLRPHKHGKKY